MPHPTTVFVRPAPGVRIADPQTGQYLPEEGLLVPRSGFWLRRLKDGDVISSAPADGTDASAAKPPTPALVAQSATALTPSAKEGDSEASEPATPEASPAVQDAPAASGQAKGKKKE